MNAYEGLWHEAQEIDESLESNFSKNNFSPKSIFALVIGLSLGTLIFGNPKGVSINLTFSPVDVKVNNNSLKATLIY